MTKEQAEAEAMAMTADAPADFGYWAELDRQTREWIVMGALADGEPAFEWKR